MDNEIFATEVRCRTADSFDVITETHCNAVESVELFIDTDDSASALPCQAVDTVTEFNAIPCYVLRHSLHPFIVSVEVLTTDFSDFTVSR